VDTTEARRRVLVESANGLALVSNNKGVEVAAQRHLIAARRHGPAVDSRPAAECFLRNR
jgi:hypothetical protein